MLNKNISITAGTAIAISMVIGSGLFGLPGLAIEATDPLTAFVGWLIVIGIMPPMIQVFSKLGREFPTAGGVTVYASYAFGKWSEAGFTLVICGALAVGMPAFFMVGGAYLVEFLNLNAEVWLLPMSIILAILSTLMNIAGVSRFAFINKFVVVTVIALMIAIALMAFRNLSGEVINFEETFSQSIGDIGQIWLVASIVFWAFQGWENLSFGLEEFKNPDRSIPIVFWASFALISLIYIVFAMATTLASLSGYNVTGLAGVTALMGEGKLRSVLLVITVLVLVANANSWVFGSSRAFYSAGARGYLPSFLASLNNNKLPIRSLVILLIVYIVVMTVMNLFDIHAKYAFLLTTQGFIILYGASIIAYWKLTSGFISKVIALAALGSWGFLMHGFGPLILYPVVLFLIGMAVFRLQGKSKVGLVENGDAPKDKDK